VTAVTNKFVLRNGLDSAEQQCTSLKVVTAYSRVGNILSRNSNSVGVSSIKFGNAQNDRMLNCVTKVLVMMQLTANDAQFPYGDYAILTIPISPNTKTVKEIKPRVCYNHSHV
jgi:hypothetical protein